MSNSQFKFGNVNLYNIYKNTDVLGDVDNYKNIPLSSGSTNYSSLKPLDFNYYYGVTSLASNRTANYDIWNTPGAYNSVPIPTGAKHVNVITVGGGGGGGGHGGKAGAKAGNGQYKSEFGGKGGEGGFGKYTYFSKFSLGNENTIKVYVGSGGNGGTSGNDNGVKSNYNGSKVKWNSPTAVGNDGNPGNNGGDSYVQIGISFLQGDRGNGGNGGNGATAKANEGSSNATPGNAGNSGNQTSSTYAGAPNTYPQLLTGGFNSGSTCGVGGSGAIDGVKPAQPSGFPGVNGSVVVVWLYE
jgi:hypothetical protein